jgi:hypothetical protein
MEEPDAGLDEWLVNFLDREPLGPYTYDKPAVDQVVEQRPMACIQVQFSVGLGCECGDISRPSSSFFWEFASGACDGRNCTSLKGRRPNCQSIPLFSCRIKSCGLSRKGSWLQMLLSGRR